jgi:hypothetical protein
LFSSTTEALEVLTAACQPATFGRNNEDVLDESYRKASKLDITQFATSFNLQSTPIPRVVETDFLAETLSVTETIKYELYKLNIYGQSIIFKFLTVLSANILTIMNCATSGKDNFFKAHKDTPRAKNMIGSLVVVFPTPHEGGALVLRHSDKQWTFDSASLVASHQKPHVGFVAFFSDVEHEVTSVVSGHRITLTYNIYKEKRNAGQIKGQTDVELERVFKELLGDTSFMPEGGNLGFGLRHQYPILSKGRKIKPDGLSGVLKGCDAALFRVCKQLGLRSSFQFFIDAGSLWLCPYMPDLSEYSEQNYESFGEEMKRHGARFVGGNDGDEYDSDDDDYEDPMLLEWVTSPTEINQASAQYIAYGNEATVEHIYGDACFIVEINDLQGRGLDDA